MHNRHRFGHSLLVFGLLFILVNSTILAMSPGRISALGTSEINSLSNAQRTNNGLPSFSLNSLLSSAAQAKAEHMLNNSYFAHTSPAGITGWDFINNSGYKYTSAGENLAASNQGASSIVQGWMASPSHRANLLSSTFTEVGYGVAYIGNWENAGQTFSDVYYVVALYAKPAIAATPPPTATTQPPTTTNNLAAPSSQASPPFEPQIEPEAQNTLASEATEEAKPDQAIEAEAVPAVQADLQPTVSVAEIKTGHLDRISLYLVGIGSLSALAGIMLEIRQIAKYSGLGVLHHFHF